MAVTSTLQFNFTPTSRDATSYTGLDRADTFFLQRPNSTNWSSSTDDEKAAALMTATRAIDTYPGILHNKFTNYNADQRLLFPQRGIPARTGVATGSSSTTLVDTGLAGNQTEPDDYWNFGAVRITSGTGLDQVREVTDFDASTGTLTVLTWDVTPDTTSNYELIHVFPDEIYYACCLISFLYVPDSASGTIDDGSERALLQAQNVKSFNADGHSEVFVSSSGYMIPAEAAQILDKYVTRAY